MNRRVPDQSGSLWRFATRGSVLLIVLIVGIPFFFAACFDGLRPKKPMTDPRMELPDVNLVGRWKLVEPAIAENLDMIKSTKPRFEISKANDPSAKGMMKIEFEMRNLEDPKQKIEWFTLFSTSEVGDMRFMNLYSKSDLQQQMQGVLEQDQKVDPYTYEEWLKTPGRLINVVRYEVSKEELTVINFGETARQKVKELRKADPKLSEYAAILKVAEDVGDGDKEQNPRVVYRKETPESDRE